MNAFTKKSLFVALAAMTVSGAADAVNISESGLGQVLIYPYYTVRGQATTGSLTGTSPFNTLMSVVNTTNTAKAVKVRFREALNSAEVLDFNLFLSAKDVWTAVITADAITGGGQISTNDNSCTLPPFGATPVNFRSSAYQGDGGGNSITRTAEGYFEIFEMTEYASGSTPAKAVTHDQSKSPPRPTCAIDDTTAATSNTGLGGGLFGTVILVNPTAGGSVTQAAYALDNFTGFIGYQTTQSDRPNYTDADPISARIAGNAVYRSTWPAPEDAVTSVFVADHVYNEFALDPLAGPAATSWVITHPTKYLYVNQTPVRRPFTVAWDKKNGGACEPVSITTYNREETSITAQDFSPPVGGLQLCYEVNILSWSARNLLNSSTFVATSTTFNNGWADVGFTQSGQQMTPTATTAFSLTAGAAPTGNPTWHGLPVIGFAAEAFQNQALTIGTQTFNTNFGTATKHRTSRSIF
jgi:hypothetical protein